MEERVTEDLHAAVRVADDDRVVAVRHLQAQFAGIRAGLHLVRVWLRALQTDVDGMAEHLGLTHRAGMRRVARRPGSRSDKP
jgi:hypothetical protein